MTSNSSGSFSEISSQAPLFLARFLAMHLSDFVDVTSNTEHGNHEGQLLLVHPRTTFVVKHWFMCSWTKNEIGDVPRHFPLGGGHLTI